MRFEEASGKVYLSREDDALRAGLDEPEALEAAVDPWEAAQTRLADTLQINPGRSPFGPITGEDGEPLRRYQAASLGDGVRIVRVWTPHELAPRESGTAHIHFFPGGRTQRSVIHLADAEERVYAVALHPLTGKGRIYNFAYEPDEIDPDETELRDPG